MKLKEYKPILVIKLIVCVLLVGVSSGILGAIFPWCISRVTELRSYNPLILLLLPFAGLVSVFIYKRLNVMNVGTMDVLESINENKQLPHRVAAAIFPATLISHLFGASCGKEGAALQLGASLAVGFSKLFKLNVNEKKMLTACGMSAFFAAMFGTPFGAAIFGTEITGQRKYNIKERLPWLLPSLVSALISWNISSSLGTHGERFHINNIPATDIMSLGKVLVIALCCALTAYIFYNSIHKCESFALRKVTNPYIRIFIGGTIVVILTFISGTFSFNGGGAEIIHGIFSGEKEPFMGFAYKILFTSISVACGYKGGEIVPTLFVGATLGSVLSGVVGLDATFCSAIGIVGLFSAMTKCPVASFVIALEMVGAKGAVFMLATVLVCNFLSGKRSLYIKKK